MPYYRAFAGQISNNYKEKWRSCNSKKIARRAALEGWLSLHLRRHLWKKWDSWASIFVFNPRDSLYVMFFIILHVTFSDSVSYYCLTVVYPFQGDISQHKTSSGKIWGGGGGLRQLIPTTTKHKIRSHSCRKLWCFCPLDAIFLASKSEPSLNRYNIPKCL